MGATLLEQFLREECTPHVRGLLREAVRGGPARRRFEFNRFEITVDREKELVTVEDVLDASVLGAQTIPLAEFVVTLARGSA
jgi:hypothetical protein